MATITTSRVFNLDQFRDSFRSPELFNAFVETFSTSLKTDLQPIVVGDRVVGAGLSAEATKNYLTDRLLRRVASKPSLLNDLLDRLENDEIVD